MMTVVVAPSVRTGTLYHLPEVNCKSAGDDQEYHDPWLHFLDGLGNYVIHPNSIV